MSAPQTGGPLGIGIGWCDCTWNPLRGCSRVSEGCRNCYAERTAIRQKAGAYVGLVRSTDAGPRWTGLVRFVEEELRAPLSWRRPRRVFVNSMSDLFHEAVEELWLDRIFAVMALSRRHTFQVLTKRPERMRDYVTTIGQRPNADRLEAAARTLGFTFAYEGRLLLEWPLPNVWLGVSVENQTTADARVPILLRTPAAVRFVSYEPALEAVDFACHVRHTATAGHCVDIDGGWKHEPGQCPGAILNCPGRCCTAVLDWLIVGGESGPRARPFNLEWARFSLEQCRAAGVPVYVKQLGARPFHERVLYGQGPWGPAKEDVLEEPLELRDRDGRDPAEWPEALRVREFPKAKA